MCRESQTLRRGAWATVGDTTLKAGPAGPGWLALALATALAGCMGSVGDGKSSENGPSGPGSPGGEPGTPGSPGNPGVERPTAHSDVLQDRPDRPLAAAPADPAGVRQLHQGPAGRRPRPGQGLQRRRARRRPSPATTSRPISESQYTQYAAAAAQAAVKTVERLGQLLPCAGKRAGEQRGRLCHPVHPPVRPPRLPAAAGRRRGQPLRVAVQGGPEQRRLRQRHRPGGPGHARVAALPLPGRRPGAADPAPAGGAAVLLPLERAARRQAVQPGRRRRAAHARRRCAARPSACWPTRARRR